MKHYRGLFFNWPWPLRVPIFVGFALIGLLIAGVLALLFGLVLMWLWNWLMPDIFGLPLLTFWQAWGLVVLCHILFKSFPHHGRPSFHDERWKRKLRDKFKEHHCHLSEDEESES